MKIAVLGLWHLGCVTAACCAKHFDVAGLDFEERTLDGLKGGKAPLFEPGLDDLIASGLSRGSLSFTSDPRKACDGADLLWICYDTPVDENDQSDIVGVLDKVRKALPHMAPGKIVLISSQLPAGTCAKLELEFPGLKFAVSPENLRLGKAIDAFEKAERVIVGVRDESSKPLFEGLFKPFAARIIFMRPESAEMVKHGLNSFLAMSVAFINEIARVCERVGADAGEVAAGLKSDIRIGPRAYLGPGGPFAGGTLARDVVTLTRFGAELNEDLALIPAIKTSNDRHRGWTFSRLESRLGPLSGKNIAILGLTYKPGTNTLRRSSAVELCLRLLKAGARVRAADPAVTELPAELKSAHLLPLAEAVRDADAAVVCTEWPEFRQFPWSDIVPTMKRPLLIDANRFLQKELSGVSNVEHLWVGGGSRP